MEDERIPKRFLMGNFVIEDQWENQEQDGRMPSRWTHHRSQKYEDGEDEQKEEKNGGVF